MESHNLNTMNSYFVPSNPTPLGKDGWVDLADYVHVAQDTQDPSYILTNSDARSNAPSVLHYVSSYNGVRLQMILVLIVWLVLMYKSESRFSQTVILWFEGIYEFFDDIMGDVPLWIKKFLMWLFFTILFANILWLFGDVIRFAFPWWLRNVTAWSWELEFNIALAIVATIVTLYVQSGTVWWPLKLLHEYFPVTGKWLMPDNKIWDIVISLFTGMLDIVGMIAKIISLSLRLFGNMSSGSILLNVAFLWLGAATVWFAATNLPIWIPLIIYLQGVLSVLIQAFVFTLIVAIGIKMVAE